ncbi:uncharacterized protein A4U43_C02F9680 [Asparagus officinalis]|uniref:Uncharacterized protein n=1 Tax=Asparagus officinalis TaxID=4686 RepID=A0A5P1FJX8_ASPOF|nr:uncharacterized protein A4U43_C02F9680 [Asparagus officinalis]
MAIKLFLCIVLVLAFSVGSAFSARAVHVSEGQNGKHAALIRGFRVYKPEVTPAAIPRGEDPVTNGILTSKENINDHIHDSQDLFALTRASPKPANSLFPVTKLHQPFEETLYETDFGLVLADSLLNLQEPPTLLTSTLTMTDTPKLNLFGISSMTGPNPTQKGPNSRSQSMLISHPHPTP